MWMLKGPFDTPFVSHISVISRWKQVGSDMARSEGDLQGSKQKRERRKPVDGVVPQSARSFIGKLGIRHLP